MESTQAILDSITNRDLALAFWLVVLLAWSASKPSVRASLRALIEAITRRQILVAFGLAAATAAGISYMLSLAGLWSLSQLKGTLIWFLVACIPSMMDIPKLSEDFGAFRKAALKNFELSVLVDFYINLFHAPLLVELIVLPVATTLTAMLVLAEHKEDLKPAIRPITNALVTIGVLWLMFQTYKLFTSFTEIREINTLRDFALPLLLNLLFLPALVLYAVYAAYDSVFARIKFVVKEPSLRTFTKLALVLRCRLNYMRLHRWFRLAWKTELTDRKKVWQSIGGA